MNTAGQADGSRELVEFMRTLQVGLNGVARSLAGAVLAAALLSSADGVAQDRPQFDKMQFMEMRSSDGRGFQMAPPGDSRGSDRDRDRDRDSDRNRSSSSSSYGSSSYGSGSSSSSSRTSSSTAATRVRVTLDLQSGYADVDSDRDGQIGLYEWKKAKRPLAQFTQLDANRDGFLTPRELERAASLPMMAATPMPSTGSPAAVTAPTPSPVMASTAAVAPSPAPAAVSKLSEEDLAKADEAQAKSTFSILDKNSDGKLSAEEMARSSRIRPLFEQAGLNFKEPMPSDQFVSNYVRIQKSKRT